MKNYFQTPVILFLGLVFMFCSCTNQTTTSDQPEGEELVVDPPSFTDCTSLCVKEDGTYSISEGCYRCMIDNLETNNNKLYPSGGRDVIGFDVNPDELKEVLNKVGSDATAEVFTMFGIKKVIDATTKEETITSELIFVVDETSTSDVTVRSFYDFTRPCPNFCPK